MATTTDGNAIERQRQPQEGGKGDEAAVGAELATVVTISHDDLVRYCAASSSSSLDQRPSTTAAAAATVVEEKIGSAFGSSPTCLGIIAVTDVPEFSSLRDRLLPLSRRLATLPPEGLEKIAVEEAGYAVGWSHGRERLEGGRPDVAKGSFYANPLTDDLAASIVERRRLEGGGRPTGASKEEGAGNRRCESENEAHPDGTTGERVGRDVGDEGEAPPLPGGDDAGFYAPNVWPSKQVPELEGTFKDMGNLIVSVGRMLAVACDAYVAKRCPGYQRDKLRSVLTRSLHCKARLLHYFAPDDRGGDGTGGDGAGFGDWCGWHNDHGSLTGLVPAMYLDADGTPLHSPPDPSAGLYIRSRSGDVVRASLPPDALAFQIGETAQVHTGGELRATPHCVRGCRRGGAAVAGVTREAFAVFLQPEYDGPVDLPPGRTVDDAQDPRECAEGYLPGSVRTLRSRWMPGMNFGEFSAATFEAFY